MMKKLSILFLTCIFLSSLLLITQLADADENDTNSSQLTWQSAIQLTNNSNSPNGAKTPFVAISPSGKSVMVAYMRKTGTGLDEADPYYRRSNDYGKTWSTPKAIYTSGTDSLFVNVTFDERLDAHAVWQETDKEIWYSKETAWPSGIKLYETEDKVNGTIEPPIIVASPNNKLDLIWAQRNNTFSAANLYHARSTNSNIANPTWPSTVSPIPLGSFIENGSSLQPDAVVDNNGILHVVWQQQAVSGFSINYTRYNGSSWTTPIKISDQILSISDPISGNQRIFFLPQIHVQGNQIFVTFENRVADNHQNVYFVECNSSCTNVNNWSGSRVSTINYSLNGTDPTFLKPQIAMSGSCPLVLFTSLNSATEVEEQIRIGSGCEEWSQNRKVSSIETLVGENVRAIVPSAATSNGWFVHLTFQLKDGPNKGDTSHIYVTRNIPGIYLPMVMK